jgi:hypothetical protein
MEGTIFLTDFSLGINTHQNKKEGLTRNKKVRPEIICKSTQSPNKIPSSIIHDVFCHFLFCGCMDQECSEHCVRVEIGWPGGEFIGFYSVEEGDCVRGIVVIVVSH